MAGISDKLTGLLPSIDYGNVLNIFIWIGLGIFVAGLAAFIGWRILNAKRFNKITVLFRMVGGQMTWVATFPTTFERIGIAGDYWARTKMGKVFKKPMWEVKLNTYLMFEREDGEWINWLPTNLDKLMKEAKVKYLDEDVRLARIAIERNLERRLDKEGFWKKYGVMIGIAAILLLILIFGLIYLKQFEKLIPALQRVADGLQSAAQAFNNANVAVNSGVVPVNNAGVPQI